jgi:hypothetical protein
MYGAKNKKKYDALKELYGTSAPKCYPLHILY